jgi:hypothetical protein
MWGLILKDLLQETRLCNRNLICMFGLGVMTFFSRKSLLREKHDTQRA